MLCEQLLHAILHFPLTVANGSISGGRTSIAIQAGKIESNPLAVTRDANENNAVTVDFGKLPKLGWRYSGYAFETPEDPLVVLGAISRAPSRRATPDATALLSNYPNPFNPETWIPYQLSKRTNVRITIYNVYGAKVRELPIGIKSAGYYLNSNRAVYWDGKNAAGEGVSTGIYFYKLQTDHVSLVRKMIIMK